MSTTQTPDSVLEDVAQLFAEQAGNLFSKSVFSVRDQVQAVPDAEEHRLERCQELFGMGYSRWLEDLGGLVQEYAEKLVKIAMACPALVKDDSAKWVRGHLELLPTKHLRLDLSLEKQEIRATQYRLARREAKEPGSAPEPEKPSDGVGCQHNHSLVGSWFRRVADNRSPLDIDEPWSAPSYCDVDNIYFSRRRREMSESRPDRLTPNQTAYVILRIEIRFADRLEYILKQAERNARITLHTNGTVPFPTAAWARKAVPSSLAAQSAPAAHDKLGEVTRPNDRGANEQYQESIFSADYRLVQFNGKTRRMTPQLAEILKVLNEHRDREVTSDELHDKTGCTKKISDSFRSKDGKALWGHLVVTDSKGRYKLKLPPSSHDSTNQNPRFRTPR